jgi:hypothetical protein
MVYYFISLEGNIFTGKSMIIDFLTKNYTVSQWGGNMLSTKKRPLFQNPSLTIFPYLWNMIEQSAIHTSSLCLNDKVDNDIVFMNQSFYSIPLYIQAHLNLQHLTNDSAQILLNWWEKNKKEHKPVKPNLQIYLHMEAWISNTNYMLALEKENDNKNISIAEMQNVELLWKECHKEMLLQKEKMMFEHDEPKKIDLPVSYLDIDNISVICTQLIKKLETVDIFVTHD